MPSFGRFGIASFLGSLVALAGCSSEVTPAENPFQKPPGCTKSACDVEYDRCYDDARSGSSSRSCTSCASLCSGAAAPASCMSSCLDLCSGPLPSVDHCTRGLQECRSTNANRKCADGE